MVQAYWGKIKVFGKGCFWIFPAWLAPGRDSPFSAMAKGILGSKDDEEATAEQKWGSLLSRPLTEHCIVQENDQAPIGDEEKEQQQRSQIRKKEESKVLKLKVEKPTLWEEDTEKNLDKSENVSQIFTSDFSNSDSPNDDPDSQTEHDFGTIETEEDTSRKLQNFLESFSSSCIDEVHNGK